MGDTERTSIITALARVEEKLTSLHSAMMEAAEVRKDHERRLRSLERNMLLAIGGGAVVMAVAQVVIHRFVKP